MRRLLAATLVLGLAACASAPDKPEPAPAAADGVAAAEGERKVSPYAPAKEDPSKRGNYTAGGLYAPGVADSAPTGGIDVSLIPEPEIVAEPRSRYGNRSTYSVLGKKYHVLDSAEGYVEEGLASYYGKKFHGRRTSNMEVYDMYAFTAAHKSLPLPSFARVTNLDNGKSVVVRVNDRGPFHKGRIIDLSYAAAVKLGITRAGTGRVEVRALLPGEAAPVLAGSDEDRSDESRSDESRSPAAVETRIAAAVPASRMDSLVAALPLDGAGAGALQLPPGVRIATGKPTRLDAATAPATPETPATSTGGIILQVASFSTRDNADRALAKLHGAGIDAARLHDATANGEQVWRLRVGPLDAAAAPALASRIAGLGLGTPQRVSE
ncbi:septal ring lytic transglycosylase RlpA family protein [Novilysobacter erysipheiresistens]|uniref:Endolytic peptidoglycan transglycosylase RlpA n=1 Tax=Novilysobacter erysipheiresistens TaxID=1749332 RepID=A0ABU7YZ82_9GAMM